MNDSEPRLRHRAAVNCIVFLIGLASAPVPPHWQKLKTKLLRLTTFYIVTARPQSPQCIWDGYLSHFWLQSSSSSRCFWLEPYFINAPRRSHAIGREDEGMRWIYIGTGVSTCILFALAIYSLATLNVIAKPTHAPALTLTVTGYDWWWKVEYEDDDPARRFVTANEIHIPVGLPVLVKLKSADVIHAFWVRCLPAKHK